MQLSSWQGALERGASRVGWKVALDFPEIEAVIGEEPVLGHITSETLLPSGASFSVSPLRAPRVETELVVELADTIEAGAGSSAVESAVAGLAVGLEIVDVARPPDDLEGIIAANVAHRACVIGPTQQLRGWRHAEARTWVDGELRGPATMWSPRSSTSAASAPTSCTEARGRLAAYAEWRSSASGPK